MTLRVRLLVIVGKADDQQIPRAKTKTNLLKPALVDEAAAGAPVEGFILHKDLSLQKGLEGLPPSGHGSAVLWIIGHGGIPAEEPGGHPLLGMPVVRSPDHLRQAEQHGLLVGEQTFIRMPSGQVGPRPGGGPLRAARGDDPDFVPILKSLRGHVLIHVA